MANTKDFIVKNGLTVGNNITVSGTVDGRDIATDGSKLDGIESGATADQSASEILTLIKTVDGSGSGLDADTLDGLQGSSYSSNNYITDHYTSNNYIQTYVAAQVASVVDSAPAALDTLNELAAALGDDANFSTTVSNQIGIRSTNTYVNSTFSSNNYLQGQLSNKLNSSSYTASDVLTKIKTVDGSGSGLDADLLDGQHASDFEPANATILHQGSDIINQDWNTFIDGTEASWNTVLNHGGSNRPSSSYTYGTALSFSESGRAKLQIYAPETSSAGGTSAGMWYRTGWNTNYRAWQRIWDSGNDGSGSGLDADLLDGVQGSSYLRSDTSDTFTGDLTINGALSATTKSFDIKHPSKDGMRLRYGSLEGPENGVYVRGKSKEKIIELPDYWLDLVHEDSITVQLTAIGKPQDLFVEKIEDNKVYVSGENYFFTVTGERKDVERFEVEYNG